MIELKILDDRLGTEFPLPGPATRGSAGFDLRAMITEPYKLEPHEMELIPSGFAVHISDPNMCMMILPRSGLSTKYGIILANTTGLIDSDYQGPIMLALYNRSDFSFLITPGDRVAQGVFVPYFTPQFQLVTEFSTFTTRGAGGFGHTGL